jgi:hypothetical protein
MESKEVTTIQRIHNHNDAKMAEKTLLNFCTWRTHSRVAPVPQTCSDMTRQHRHEDPEEHTRSCDVVVIFDNGYYNGRSLIVVIVESCYRVMSSAITDLDNLYKWTHKNPNSTVTHTNNQIDVRCYCTTLLNGFVE